METAAIVVGALVAIGVAYRLLAARTQRRHERRAEALALLGVRAYPEALGRADLSGDSTRIGWELAEAVLQGPRGVIVDWRATPAETLTALAPALRAATGASLDVDEASEDAGEEGAAIVTFRIAHDGVVTAHRGRRRDADERTDALVAGAVGLVPGAKILAALPYERTDTAGYVVVTREEDEQLHELLAERYAWVFAPAAATGDAILPPR